MKTILTGRARAVTRGGVVVVEGEDFLLGFITRQYLQVLAAAEAIYAPNTTLGTITSKARGRATFKFPNGSAIASSEGKPQDALNLFSP